MKKNIVLLLLIVTSITLFAENRIALLIANGKYTNFSSLSGPIAEAEELAATLKSLGFDVKLLENATRAEMLDELDNLKSRVNGKGGVAFFHYGGHGVQVNGSNYLIPIDADIPDERKVVTRAVNIDEIMSSLDTCGSDTNIVILDACRNNPLPAGAGRSATRGLSVVGAKPKNSIIVYSAEAGTVAQDGLFTPTLTKLITQSGKSLNQILMQLRREVSTKSNGSQIPGEYNQLFDDIYLNKTIATPEIEKNTNLLTSDSLIGEYLFQKNYNDTSRNKSAAIASNVTYSIDRNGKKDSAIHFSGNNSYLEIPSNTLRGLESYSISFWLYLDRVVNNTQAMLINSIYIDGSKMWQVTLFGNNYEGDGMRIVYSISDNNKTYSPLKLDKMKWYNICVTYQENRIVRIYVDGNLTTEKEVTNGRSDFFFPVTIGAPSYKDDQYSLIGSIDDILIYNRVLTNEEMKAIIKK